MIDPATLKFYTERAPHYTFSFAQSHSRSLDPFLDRLEPGARVLELGCGTGSTALLLADAVAHLTATDISDRMLDAGRAKNPPANLDLLRSDIVGAPTGPFDVIMAFNLMHLVPGTNAALAQIRDRLKPGGLFISKTPCNPERRPPFKYRMLRLALPLMQWVGKAPYVNFMDVRAWDAKIEAAGFEIIESGNHPAHPPSRYLVARKT